MLHDGRHIGHVQAVPIKGGWEIGYHIGAAHAGNGYATEAVKAFLPPIMERLGISRIAGICDAENAVSRRVLEKCGFAPEFAGDKTCRYGYTPFAAGPAAEGDVGIRKGISG